MYKKYYEIVLHCGKQRKSTENSMDTETKIQELETRIKQLEEQHYKDGTWDRPEYTTKAKDIEIHGKGFAGSDVECTYMCACSNEHHAIIHVEPTQTFPFKYRKTCERYFSVVSVIEFDAENVKKA
jgi:hypothetical protein